MDWWHAIVLGIVEGLTEYLPVSSTGHLLLAQRLLGIEHGDSANAFAICIQSGAILAVLGLYFNQVRKIAEGALGRNPDGLRLGINIGVAFLPAAFAGIALEKPIKHYLFGGDRWGLWPTVLAWFVGGVAILAVSAWRSRRSQTATPRITLFDLTWKSAVIIGVIQCLAMWPGVSRSLVTIVGGVLVGMTLASAVEFSFLLGVVTLTAATAYDALKHGREMLDTFGAIPILLGLVASWVSAVIAVKWMVHYLNKHGMAIFGYYRILLAIVVAIFILTGFFA